MSSFETFRSLRCNKIFSVYTICVTFLVVLTAQIESTEATYQTIEYQHPQFEYAGVANWNQLGKDDVVILWWTGRIVNYMRGLELVQCPNSKCYHTTDRSRNYVLDKRIRGFVFYGTDMDLSDMPLPRMPHHEWALFHEESPFNKYELVHGKMIRLFNHTATFRRESDFPLTTQHIPSLQYLIERKPIPVAKKNELIKKKGLAPILYVQSHCDVPSDRDRYVSKLAKFIKIDSRGKCLNNKEMPKNLQNAVETMHDEIFLDLIAQYKFVLAFENALCRDYMTEKLFRTLHVGSVPVYRGSSAAKNYMPDDHSIIMADEYESPQKLADYLHMLDNDDDAYEAYLQYKTTGVTNEFLKEQMMNRGWSSSTHPEIPDMIQGFKCHLCDKLTERFDTEQIHAENSNIPLMPPKSATLDHLQCPQPYTSIGHPEDYKKSDSWNNMHWVDDYWGGMDKAKAFNLMLENNETDSSRFDKYWEMVVRSTHF